MVGNFYKKSSVNILLLLFYAILLKWPVLKNVEPIAVSASDGVLFQNFANYLNGLKFGNSIANSIAFALIFIQAIQISYLFNTNKFFVNANYLVGMAYILCTSFLHKFNVLNSGLVLNSIFLLIWFKSFSLIQTNSGKSLIFNLALALSLGTFINKFSFVFVAFVIYQMALYRRFKWNEYAVLVLGLLVPYYFLGGYAIYTGQNDYAKYLVSIKLQLPKIENPKLLFATVMVLISLLILGIILVQSNNKKLPIQSRKVWGATFVYFLSGLLVSVLCNQLWFYVMCLLPLSAFVAAFFYYLKPYKMAIVLHWLLFVYAVANLVLFKKVA